MQEEIVVSFQIVFWNLVVLTTALLLLGIFSS